MRAVAGALLLRLLVEVSADSSVVSNVVVEEEPRSSSPRWVCPKPDLHATNCSAFDSINEQPEWGLYFADHPRFECDLAIINAGMPRTGSTLLQELVVDAVALVGKSFRPLSFSNGVYWRVDRHVRDRAKSWEVDVPANTDIVLFKSHSWDSELASICQRNLVLMTDRDPTAMIASKIKAFIKDNEFRSETACDDTYALLLRSYRMNYCWKTHAQYPFRVSYEHMKHSKAAVTAALATIIASLFDLVVEDPSEETVISYTFRRGFHEAEANPGIPGLVATVDYEAALAQEIKDSLPPDCQDRHLWADCFADANK